MFNSLLYVQIWPIYVSKKAFTGTEDFNRLTANHADKWPHQQLNYNIYSKLLFLITGMHLPLSPPFIDAISDLNVMVFMCLSY